MEQKNLITVITDNHLMADTIAKAICANETHDGYYLGNGYAVTWTNGELIEATFKAKNSLVLSTSMKSREVYAHNFEFAMRNYDEVVGYKKSAADARHLGTIRSLWEKSHTVINAMLPCEEGELMFLNLYYYLATPVTVKRAWLPVLTRQAIRNAVFNGRTDTDEYEKWLGEAIINRIIEVDKDALLETLDDTTDFGCEVEDMWERENEVSDGMTEDPEPTLYCMYNLANDVRDSLGWDFDRMFYTAMMLYFKKLISFPFYIETRIPKTVCHKMKRNIRTLIYHPKWGKLAPKAFKPDARHIYDGRQTAFNGYGIVTTGIHPTDLSGDERKLYSLIVKRVIDAFTPLAENETKNDKTL